MLFSMHFNNFMQLLLVISSTSSLFERYEKVTSVPFLLKINGRILADMLQTYTSYVSYW